MNVLKSTLRMYIIIIMYINLVKAKVKWYTNNSVFLNYWQSIPILDAVITFRNDEARRKEYCVKIINPCKYLDR